MEATVMAAGFVELHVKGTPIRFIPRLSVAVAFNVIEVPAFTKNEVAEVPSALTEIL